MRQLIIIATISIVLFLLNKIAPVNFLFETKNLSKSAFLVNDSDIDSTIIILNIGDLEDNQIADEIDSIILQAPRAIGLDVCGIGSDSLINARFQEKSVVTILNCSNDTPFGSSIIDNGTDGISRFKTDSPEYFEIKVANAWDKISERRNESELINYKGVTNRFATIDLKDAKAIPLKDKIVLISYLGSTVTYNEQFSNTESGLHQIQHSAFIISTIVNNDFINEGNFMVEALLIIVVVLLNFWVLTVVPVKNPILYTLIAYASMSLVKIGVTVLVFLLFLKGFYLHTNGLTSILVITTLYACLTKSERSSLSN
jgi:hypothetical protein